MVNFPDMALFYFTVLQYTKYIEWKGVPQFNKLNIHNVGTDTERDGKVNIQYV